MTKDLYEDLGVDKDADQETIRRTYRKRAKKAHPDAGGDPAEFAALALAHAVLSDTEKRALYDETGETSSAIFEEQGAKALLVAEMMEAAKMPGSISELQLVNNMQNRLEQNLDAAEANIEKHKLAIKNVGIIHDRLKYFGKGQSHLHLVLDNQKRELEAGIVNIQRTLRIIQRALELLEDYEFESKGVAYDSWFGGMAATIITVDEFQD